MPVDPEEPEEGEIEQTAEERKNAKINPGREVVINGIIFIADAKGKKLVRKSCRLLGKEQGPHKPAHSASLTPLTTLSLACASLCRSTATMQTNSAVATGNPTESTSTPSKTSIDGQFYVRTKSGNLISSDLVKKRELEAKKKRLDHLVGVIKGVQKARGCVSWHALTIAGSRTQIFCIRRQGRSAAANKKIEQQRKTLCRFFQKTGKAMRSIRNPKTADPPSIVFATASPALQSLLFATPPPPHYCAPMLRFVLTSHSD